MIGHMGPRYRCTSSFPCQNIVTMRKIAAALWANAPGITGAGRAFLSRWLELFGRDTIDTYRVRHLNLHRGVHELVAVIDDVTRVGTHALNVKEVAAHGSPPR